MFFCGFPGGHHEPDPALMPTLTTISMIVPQMKVRSLPRLRPVGVTRCRHLGVPISLWDGNGWDVTHGTRYCCQQSTECTSPGRGIRTSSYSQNTRRYRTSNRRRWFGKNYSRCAAGSGSLLYFLVFVIRGVENDRDVFAVLCFRLPSLPPSRIYLFCLCFFVFRALRATSASSLGRGFDKCVALINILIGIVFELLL